MVRNQGVEPPNSRRFLARILALTALLACLGSAPAALAKSPTGHFAVFAQCPRFTPGVEFCLVATTNSGSVTLNKQTVPITNPITLQGGSTINEETGQETFVGALNGETLSKSPQKVPGGLAGLLNCPEIKSLLERIACEAVFENGATGVNATTELARPASEIGISKNNLINREGVALSLPVKVHLENPLLGSGCYVGSTEHPIVWNLTTGRTSPPPPNTPIEGTVGTVKIEEEADYIEITGNKIVDNSFAAPGASGCGGLFAFLLDPIINSKIGLPSAGGRNTAILNNTVKQATGEAVIKSEK